MNRSRLAELNRGGPGRPGPGERLRLAREAWGMSVEHVAETLRLPVPIIKGLEREDYQGLPPEGFVRGYVGGYARLVGLDADALLADCAMHGCGDADLAARRSLSLRRKGAESLLRWGSYAALALFVVAALAFWVDRGEHTPGAVEVADATPSEVSVAAAGVPAGEPVASGADLGVVSAAVPSAVPGDTAEAADTSVARRPLPVVPTAEDWGTLELAFEADSWVAVLDSDGRRIAWEMVKAGSQRSMSGPPPLKVVLGNASRVRVTYDGQSIDPTPYTEGRIARFSVE